MSTEPSAPEIRPLNREQHLWRGKILLSTYMAYAGYYLSRKAFTICKTSIGEEFDWDMQDVAHIWTAYLVAYMLGQFINSFIGRKWGPRVLLLGGFGMTIIVNALFGLANSYWTFIAFMFFNGLLQASGWPGCVGGVSEWLRKHERGTVMGFWSTSYVIGNMLVKNIGGYLLVAHAWLMWFHGWRYAFFGCSVLAFCIWWLVFFWQRNRPEDVGIDPIIDPEEATGHTVKASNAQHITWRDYLALLANPVIPVMGLAYFCLKFLRYALDSWLPTFLNLQGLPVDKAAYYSQIFDWAGLAGMIVTGFLLDRVFKQRWERLCIFCGVGMLVGYLLVGHFGANPMLLSLCYGLVGFMLYSPDALLCGAASVQVAGERNGVAVAGIVNGIGSIGPVVQEEVIGWLMGGGRSTEEAIKNANTLALTMSGIFLAIMILLTIYMRGIRKRQSGQA